MHTNILKKKTTKKNKEKIKHYMIVLLSVYEIKKHHIDSNGIMKTYHSVVDLSHLS